MKSYMQASEASLYLTFSFFFWSENIIYLLVFPPKNLFLNGLYGVLASHQFQRNHGKDSIIMKKETQISEHRQKWKKVAYGGVQPAYDDNYTDDSFLEAIMMNANVVKRDLVKVQLDSIFISQYLCIVALVITVWTQTLLNHTSVT